jgi:hypothetical protein
MTRSALFGDQTPTRSPGAAVTSVPSRHRATVISGSSGLGAFHMAMASSERLLVDIWQNLRDTARNPAAVSVKDLRSRRWRQPAQTPHPNELCEPDSFDRQRAIQALVASGVPTLHSLTEREIHCNWRPIWIAARRSSALRAAKTRSDISEGSPARIGCRTPASTPPRRPVHASPRRAARPECRHSTPRDQSRPGRRVPR